MSSLGDFAAQSNVHCFFNTHQADGTPITLAGTPSLAVYKDDGNTETTTGPALTIDFDGKTGLHLAKITTTDAFYAAGHDYQIVIAAGTVDSISVAGSVVGSFSIVNRPVAVGDKTGFALTSAYDPAKTAAQASDIPSTSISSILAIAQKLDTALELDGAVYRLTLNALERAPSGTTVAPTVEEIEAWLAGIHGSGLWDRSGSGTTLKPYTQKYGGVALAGCEVWVTTDLAGTITVASGTTDALGKVYLYPDVPIGTTLYIWRKKVGYEFTNPGLETM
jgi:hypothetical protein